MSISTPPEWPASHLTTSPWFASLQAILPSLAWPQFPTATDWAALPEAKRPCNARGQSIQFLPPAELVEANYEARIYEQGHVATRPDDWHDAFNALCWLAWPQAKAALNALHYAELARQQGAVRSRARDAATLFDESGLILACADAHLAAALRAHDWATLFQTYAPAWGRTLAPYIIGHALLEKGLSPFIGIVAKTLIVDVPARWFDQPADAQIAYLDAHVATRISSGALAKPTILSPLPVLGIPGWWPLQDAAFYANRQHFRPRRLQVVA